MSFTDDALSNQRPDSVSLNVKLPRRLNYYPSPVSWRDEVLYFLLVDRFSDEEDRPMLDRNNLTAARPDLPDGPPWRWDLWAESGNCRWQGGTIRGVTSRLDYLKRLGVSTIWLSPIFKQRCHMNTYHGYGIQDFLDVDPRFGDRKDLVELVDEAHKKGIRIILDIIFNHSGANWVYPDGQWTPPYKRYPDCYDFGSWVGETGQFLGAINNREEGVWPEEFQDKDCYTRAGLGNLGEGDLNDNNAPHKRSDFFDLRDFRLTGGVLNNLTLCYKYWIALLDIDGFRIDTLKHVSFEEARNFCGSIKEFAANIGKNNFFLIGEIGGGDYNEQRYLDVLDRNLNAALDIGDMRPTLNCVAKGLTEPKRYFDGFDNTKTMGSHRNLGDNHISILEDHDQITGEKIRFSSEASSDHQIAAGVAIQLFTLGIPCIYYGMEQAFAGPELSERRWLPNWKGGTDRYLREAMFGPDHPRKDGNEGLQAAPDCIDTDLPGFGPFGTSGHHCFNEKSPAYVRIAALTKLRSEYPVLRYGRQYQRQISIFDDAFKYEGYELGQIVAWSRILDDEEALCVFNSHGADARGADVLVASELNAGAGGTMTVIVNSAQAASPGGYAGSHPVGSTVQVNTKEDGKAYVEIRNLPASEILVLTNKPVKDGGIV
jgi:glycosidase